MKMSKWFRNNYSENDGESYIELKTKVQIIDYG